MGTAPRGGTLIALFVFALALAVAPGLAAPFSSAKTIALGLFAVAALIVALVRRRAPEGSAAGAGALIWVAAAALGTLRGHADPVALALIAAAATLAIAGGPLELSPERVLVPLAAAGAPVACVVLLQRAGLDPFAALGWSIVQTGARLRLYGTLGNPDFVAGFLAPALLAALGLAWLTRRRRWLAIAVLQLLALCLLRSFATVLALSAGAAVWLWARPRARVLAIAAVGLVALGLATSGRPLVRTVEGRLYVWQVALPHLRERPLFGHGPGASYHRWSSWEAQRSAEGRGDPRFSATVTHLDCDLLEVALDEGLIGLAGLVLLLGAGLAEGLRRARTDPASLVATSALAAILARALVDFSLQRPAELGLAVALVLAVCRTQPAPEAVACTAPEPSASRS